MIEIDKDKEVECLKCGSFIHETEKCYVWKVWNYC